MKVFSGQNKTMCNSELGKDESKQTSLFFFLVLLVLSQKILDWLSVPQVLWAYLTERECSLEPLRRVQLHKLFALFHETLTMAEGVLVLEKPRLGTNESLNVGRNGSLVSVHGLFS